VIFFYLFSSALHILLNFKCICFLSLRAIFCFINLDSRLIQIISPTVIWIAVYFSFVLPSSRTSYSRYMIRFIKIVNTSLHFQ
jgi:ABC-type transport system involved in cytochrome c biogenesis permease component